MAKTYPQLLGEWVRRRESSRRDRNLVAFLAVRDDVKRAVEDGYAVKTIWANMREDGRIAFGYDTFLNYVKRHIGRPSAGPADTSSATPPLRPAAEPGRSAPKSGPGEPGPQKRAPDPVAGFTFNAAPRKEDLL